MTNGNNSSIIIIEKTMNEQKRKFLIKQLTNSIEKEIDIYIKFGLPQDKIQEVLQTSLQGLREI